MTNNTFKGLKKEYTEVPIPAELHDMVSRGIDRGILENRRRAAFRRLKITAASIAASLTLFTAGVNLSPAFAYTMSRIPVLDKVVGVLTIKEFVIDEDKYNADIKVPSIDGLENKELENSLNEKYLEENKKLYEGFVADMEELKKNGGGYMGIDSGYIVKTDTEKLLSVGRYVVNTVGSSSTTMKYDTIDKENEVLITLPSLFADDSYVDAISSEIKKQMIEQNKADENKYYWVEGIEESDSMELFDKISNEQNFYISSDNKLVISFDKYEVAPGYMGVIEFEIPTDVISSILVSDEYIK